MKNLRIKLSIFHNHNGPHTTRPPGAGDWLRGSSTYSSHRKEKYTHLDATPCDWSAVETPNYAQEMNRHAGASHFAREGPFKRPAAVYGDDSYCEVYSGDCRLVPFVENVIPSTVNTVPHITQQ